MTNFDSKHGVVAIGASAGGVEALIRLAANLSRDLSYAIVVVLHMPANASSVLARILDRAGPLPAVTAVDGGSLEAGTIYVSRPGRHLMVHDGRIVLSEGPTENGHRPAVNALFRSVALAYGPHVIGVLLSGVLDDGVLGAAAIKRRGGLVIAQSPADALFPAMPTNAMHAGVVDHVADAADMGGLLKQLTERPTEERDMEPDESMELENRIAMAGRFSTDFDSEVLGPLSGYICPDCNGSLSTVSEGNFRCRVGHAWTADALLRARDQEVEGALWVALRSLEEKAKLSRRLAEKTGAGVMVQRYEQLAAEAEHAVSVLSERLSEVGRQVGDLGDPIT